MGRRKLITDEQIIEMIDKFYIEQYEGEASLLKVPAIGTYIRNHGYPDCKDYLIRRSEAAQEYIEKLKAAQDGNELNILSTYKTIDVDEFIEHNHSKTAMKKALSELNMYYKSVSDAASKMHKKNIELEEKIKKSSSNIKISNEQTKHYEQEITDLKHINKALRDENKNLRIIIDTYVYPEIANELLKESGLLQDTDGIVNPEQMKSQIIHADTPVKSQSNVIQGLFNKMED